MSREISSRGGFSHGSGSVAPMPWQRAERVPWAAAASAACRWAEVRAPEPSPRLLVIGAHMGRGKGAVEELQLGINNSRAAEMPRWVHFRCRSLVYLTCWARELVFLSQERRFEVVRGTIPAGPTTRCEKRNPKCLWANARSPGPGSRWATIAQRGLRPQPKALAALACTQPMECVYRVRGLQQECRPSSRRASWPHG